MRRAQGEDGPRSLTLPDNRITAFASCPPALNLMFFLSFRYASRLGSTAHALTNLVPSHLTPQKIKRVVLGGASVRSNIEALQREVELKARHGSCATILRHNPPHGGSGVARAGGVGAGLGAGEEECGTWSGREGGCKGEAEVSVAEVRWWSSRLWDA